MIISARKYGKSIIRGGTPVSYCQSAFNFNSTGDQIKPIAFLQLADDEALSTNKIIALIAESQNKKVRIWHLPVKLINFLARLGDFLPLPLNSERLKKLTESYVFPNQKIKKALGIEKMPVSAEEGMKKTFESFQG